MTANRFRRNVRVFAGLGLLAGVVIGWITFPGMAIGAEESRKEAVVTAFSPEELEGFSDYPEGVRNLIEQGLALTKLGLGYEYGSADPAKGGMDCSGTIYHLLKEAGLSDVPRTASDQYVWARKADEFQAVLSRDVESFELDDLRPGDLLFWTGTYSADRDPPVTHTMIYLGKAKSDGRMLMFGASDGRSYRGEKQSGVSVFDFVIPQGNPAGAEGAAPGARFVGYARVPGL